MQCRPPAADIRERLRARGWLHCSHGGISRKEDGGKHKTVKRVHLCSGLFTFAPYSTRHSWMPAENFSGNCTSMRSASVVTGANVVRLYLLPSQP
jgi:hypothetical protein